MISIRPLRETDLPEADRIMRLAFGTQFQLEDPSSAFGDTGYVRPRWRSSPSTAFAAELDGELAGSNFATLWGSVGFFGPLTVRPDLWNRGIGRHLIEPVVEVFNAHGTRLRGLMTFPDSEKHVALYQRFGFWPRFLTALVAKSPDSAAPSLDSDALFSQLSGDDCVRALAECRDIAGAVFEGLDLTPEIRAVGTHGLGDTVLSWNGAKLGGFAVCHTGPDTEGSSKSFYVKFAAVRPGDRAAFERLAGDIERAAAGRGADKIVAGVNTARHDAYRLMLARGYRTLSQGIAMHGNNDPGYSRPDVYALDDWR